MKIKPALKTAGKTLGGLLLAALKIYITGLIVKKASKL
jgi:hypothetical protein